MSGDVLPGIGIVRDSTVAYIRKLTEARDRVARQIEILEGGRPYYAINREAQIRDVLEKLHRTISELEECIGAAADADRSST